MNNDITNTNDIVTNTDDMVTDTMTIDQAVQNIKNNTIRVAINGCGRIGRAFVRMASHYDNIQIVAVNDLSDIDNMAYLLQYDSVYKTAPFISEVEKVSDDEQYLVITCPADGANYEDEKEIRIRYLSVKDPALYTWGEMGIDVVVECTGLFTSFDAANVHIEHGARRVVISAPAKGESTVAGETVLMRINDELLHNCQISSNASCTTNASSPVISILNDTIGIEKAILNTIHSYTASQSVVDGPNKKDWREGRAAAQNIVPSSTGAAVAVTKAIPALAGNFDGISIRVPTPAGSIADITFISKRPTTVEEVNQILSDASDDSRWEGVFLATDEDLVSSDIIGLTHASIVDLKMTRVVGGNLVKVLAWYDNEAGYTNTLIEHVIKVGNI